MKRTAALGIAGMAVLAALAGAALWRTAGERASARHTLVQRPARVMGTSCTLAAVVRPDEAEQAARALEAAEAALRQVEARMSVHLEDSEVSRLNAAPAGQRVRLSADTATVLRAAEKAHALTDGAFDITCGPLIQLWRRAAERGALPADDEIARARAASGWRLIELVEDGARKRSRQARVELGGIAKGYAIDRAAAVLRGAPVQGGLVEVGGDLRVIGQPPVGDRWKVDLRDPFGDALLGRLRVSEGAVCTSGNYARFAVIEGRRYSHVVDPRTGRPADAVPSVTVTAPTAIEADVWATALSVLGPDGVGRLPGGVEALFVLGSADDWELRCTPGMPALFPEPPAPLAVIERTR